MPTAGQAVERTNSPTQLVQVYVDTTTWDDSVAVGTS